MEKKYTKGPWKVQRSESKPAYNIIGTALGGKYKIARCPIVDFGPEYPETNKAELEEVQANAKLIAASPELLEALIELKRWVGQVTDWEGAGDPPTEIVDAAIKKATE